jgi:ubiquinone/menaquinone biosynthesis C-methylase UbiE
MSPEDLHQANLLMNFNNKVKNWYWAGEPGFIKLVEDNQSEGMVVVEIGCYDGSTTIKYIDIVKRNNGHVIIIDTFEGTVATPETINNDPSYSSNVHWKRAQHADLHKVYVE